MKSEQKTEIGDRLSAVRSQHRLSQREVGERLKVSGRVYQNCEIGTRELPADLLIKFCAEFGVRPEWVVTGSKPMLSIDIESAAEEIVRMVSKEANERAIALSPETFGAIIQKLLKRKYEQGEITHSEVANYVELAGGEK